MWSLGLLACLSGSSCDSLRAYITEHEQEGPDPALGRPGFVRAPARFGSWVGGIAGAVTSVALLPITYPISLISDEPAGKSHEQLFYGPVSIGAGAGHFLLGAPADFLHFVFYRAWTGKSDDDQPGYDFVPMKEPPLRDQENVQKKAPTARLSAGQLSTGKLERQP